MKLVFGFARVELRRYEFDLCTAFRATKIITILYRYLLRNMFPQAILSCVPIPSNLAVLLIAVASYVGQAIRRTTRMQSNAAAVCCGFFRIVEFVPALRKMIRKVALH